MELKFHGRLDMFEIRTFQERGHIPGNAGDLLPTHKELGYYPQHKNRYYKYFAVYYDRPLNERDVDEIVKNLLPKIDWELYTSSNNISSTNEAEQEVTLATRRRLVGTDGD